MSTQTMENLEYVDVSYNQIKQITGDFARAFQNVVQFTAESNGLERIPPVLCSLKKLTSLNLSKVKISFRVFSKVPNYFPTFFSRIY